jgi:hypothetical protein
MPSIGAADDLIAAASALTDATAAAEITPNEAAALSTLVSKLAKAVETVDLAERLAKLEEQIARSCPKRGAARSRKGRWRREVGTGPACE